MPHEPTTGPLSRRKGPYGSCGSLNRQSKLTEETVLDIRRRLNQGESVTALAHELQLAVGTISKIKHHQTWQHVSLPETN